MGAPKQKWTAEEEAALRAGVEKHGPGKWRTIQKDPDFAPCLASRSNVDLKDKWRNLNVGSSGYGSRSLKIFSKNNAKQANEPIAAVPTACLPPDNLLLADTPRYENLVVEAIHGLSDPNGSSLLFIASYIEERYPVPSDFRRLLGIKLREMVIRGILIKWKQNFKVNDASLLHGTSMAPQEGDGNGQILKICAAPSSVRAIDPESQAEGRHANPRQTMHRPYKNARGEPAVKKTRVDGDYARSKLRTLEAAAIAASAAVAEAEAAAAAAEQAAREAEAAEAEAEAAEIAAEIAALAVRRTNEMPAVTFAWDKLAVTG